jgi:ABC-type phosphate transport system substrate-binding protein
MRRSIKRLFATTVTAFLAVVLAASVAQADPGNYHPPFTPDADDVVGVGSDTTQHLLNAYADGQPRTSWTDGYNELGADGVAGTADDFPRERLASFDATGPSPIVIRPGCPPIQRPNGSSAGINALLDDPCIDFARSSRPLTSTEVARGLRMVPFARDGLRMVGNRAQTGSPAALTASQLWRIYECQAGFDQWSEVGGTSTAVIAPMLPPAGSGMAAFFLDQLSASKGTPVVVGACVQNVRDNDVTPILDNVNALAPMTIATYNSLPPMQRDRLKLFGGFAPSRVQYTIIRAANVTQPRIQAIFGQNGFICRTAKGREITTAFGFTILATGCGVARTTPLP